jgi:S1-C subfamily serine protease
VVDGAHSLSVRVGKAVTHGTVVALDTKKDLALVRLKSRLPGHVLQWAPVPAVGAEVAVVGYPLGEPLTFTGGHVNAVDARLEMTDTSLTHMVKYDAATNGGNSGGPVVSVDGRVVGLVDIGTTEAQGESFAIAAAAAQDLIGLWMTSTDSVPLASCRDPWNDLVTVTSVHADAPAMAITFHSFFSGINEGDYSTSFGELTGAARGQFAGLGGFEQQYDGVTVSDVVIEKALLATNTSDLVTVSYREQFDDKGASTSSCKDFHVRYLLRNDTGWWVIDSVTQLKGSPSRC